MDVFDGAEILDFTLTRRDVAWLRAKYGPLLTWSAPPSVRLLRVWEVSQQMSVEVQLLDGSGVGIAGEAVKWTWPQNNLFTFDGETDMAGISHFTYGSGNHYNAGAGQAGPNTFKALEHDIIVSGLGWPDLTNHDHLNLIFQVGGSPTPPPPGGTIDVAALKTQLGAIQHALDAIAGILG